MAQTAKPITFGDFNVQEMVQVYRRCPEAVTFLFRGSDSIELGLGLELCREGQADNGGIPLLKDVDVSKVASSSKLNAQAPVFKPILPVTAGPAQPSEGAKSTTASPSSSDETTTSSIDSARHTVLEPEGAKSQLCEGHNRAESGQSSHLVFQNVDPSIVTFVCESSIAANQADGVQRQTSPQTQDSGRVEFLYELGSCRSRSNSHSKGSARTSPGASDVSSKAPPTSSAFSDSDSPSDGQLLAGSISLSLNSEIRVPSSDSGSKTPPLSTGGAKTPPLPTSGAKTPPLPTSGAKTPPLPTSGAKTPPLPTSGSKTPPLPTSGAKTPPLPTNGAKTPPLPTNGAKTPPLPTSGAKTPPLPTSGAKTPPLPTSGAKTPPLPTSGAKTPPLPTSGAKTPPLPTSGSKTPPLHNSGAKTPLPTSVAKVVPSSTVSTMNPARAADHHAAMAQSSSTDSCTKPPPAATPVATSAWSRPKDWGTVFGSSTAGGGGPRPLAEKPPESTSPPESGIADMHEGAEDRSSERSNPLLVQLGEKLRSLQVCYGEEVKLVPRGLVNAANLCYMHCILQMLLACPPLVNLLRSLNPDTPPSTDPSPTPMLDCMVRFVHEFESADEYQEGKRKRKSRSPQDFLKGTSIKPDYMYQVLDKTKSSLSRTVRGRQEDAQEFLGLVLDSLHEEMVAALSTVTHGPVSNPDKSSSLEDHPDDSLEEGEELGEGEEWEQVGWNNKSMVTRQTSYRESPISQIFGGELLSIVQKQGSKESATVEPFFALPLDIQDESVVTVQQALERLGAREVLHDMYCSKTNTEVEASRKMTLSRLPPVLVLHLKQFSFTNKGSQKLNKPIEYSMELEIPRELLAQPVRKKVTLEQRKYQLLGVVYHHGLHAAGGHYTSDVRLAQSGGWFNANDNHLKPLSEEQVLRGQCKEINKVAYLLCYRRSTE